MWYFAQPAEEEIWHRGIIKTRFVIFQINVECDTRFLENCLILSSTPLSYNKLYVWWLPVFNQNTVWGIGAYFIFSTQKKSWRPFIFCKDWWYFRMQSIIILFLRFHPNSDILFGQCGKARKHFHICCWANVILGNRFEKSCVSILSLEFHQVRCFP